MPFPYADSSGQWWAEGRKVFMFKVSDEEQKRYAENQLGSVGKLVTPSDCKSDAEGIASSSLAAPTNLPRM